MIRRPPRSTPLYSSAASDVYKRQVAESLPLDIEKKIKSIDEIKSCKVNVVFEPAWNKDMMSDEAKLELGML